jgi:hypothetical protein
VAPRRTPRRADGWLRSPRSVVALLVAALIAALVVAAVIVILRKPGADAVRLQGEPMTDAAAAGQVVESAKQIVSAAQLHGAAGGYSFVSCKNKTEPPYQVALYMNFVLPQSNSVKYLRDIGATMVSHGWTRAPTTDEHFGQKLTKDGVTAIVYGGDNDAGVATMRLYGECRVTADHRNDSPVWTDLAGRLG